MRPLAVLGVLIGVAFAACGGDDGGTSPTGSGTAGPTETPAASTATVTATGEQLSYIGPNGEIRLVNSDGTDDHVFNDTICVSADKGMDFSMTWSPNGAMLARYCPPEPDRTQAMAILGPDGSELWRVEDVTYARWSPDSTRIAYGTGEFAVRMLDARTGQTRDLHGDAVLLRRLGARHGRLRLRDGARDRYQRRIHRLPFSGHPSSSARLFSGRRQHLLGQCRLLSLAGAPGRSPGNQARRAPQPLCRYLPSWPRRVF